MKRFLIVLFLVFNVVLGADLAFAALSTSGSLSPIGPPISVCLSGDNYNITTGKPCPIGPPISVPVPPVINSLTAGNIDYGSSPFTTITWSTANTVGSSPCTASGAWSGSKPPQGSLYIGPLSGDFPKTFSLSCVGASGTTPATRSVTVNMVGGPIVPATPINLKTKVDYSFGSGNSEAFVQTWIAGYPQNVNVAYWKLDSSCPEGVEMIGQNSENLCGRVMRFDRYNIFDPTKDYLVLTVGVVNKSSSARTLILSLTAHDENGNIVGKDSEGVALNGVLPPPTASFIEVFNPRDNETWYTGKTYQIKWENSESLNRSARYIEAVYVGGNGGTLNIENTGKLLGDQPYFWTVPKDWPLYGDFKIRVGLHSTNIYGESGVVNISDNPIPPPTMSGPDLVVSGLSWTPENPVVTRPVGYLNVTVDVKNIGDNAVTLPEGMRISLYKGDGGPEGEMVGGVTIGSARYVLNPSQTQEFIFNTTQQPNVLENAGTFVLNAVVDDANIVRESNDSNNYLVRRLVVSGSTLPPVPIGDLPDLTASAVTPITATVGVLQTYSAVITNSGTVPTSTTGKIAHIFQFRSSPTSSIISRLISRKPIVANGTDTISYRYTFSNLGTRTVANRYIRVCADSTGTIKESNEENNCSPWTVIKVSLPPQTANVLDALKDTTNSEDFSTGCKFTTTLKKGMSHPEVQCLQQILNAKGYNVLGTEGGKETTYFGNATLKALESFQDTNYISIDGIFGPNSMDVLGN